jgi:hypothetical protein
MWHEYYTNATICGLDISKPCPAPLQPVANTSQRVVLYMGEDAYNPGNVYKNFIQKEIAIDVFVDDGPHSLKSMKDAIQYYLPLLAHDGIFVIEDVQSTGWATELRELVPAPDLPYVYVVDLRTNKGRGDDIMFIIDREIVFEKLIK